MNSRLMRVLIAFIGIIVGCTAGYFLKDLDSTIAVQRGAADALRDQSRALGAAIADVRSAQVAYVARGQGEGFWMCRRAGFGSTAANNAASEALRRAAGFCR